MDSRTKEIRRILTGLITYEMDGTVITAAKSLLELQTDGIFSGSDNARLLGLRVVKHQYRIKNNIPTAHETCMKAFNTVGARVHLYTAPDALAVLCHLLWFNPLVLTLEAQDDQLLLCVYTARSLTAAWGVKLLRKRLDKGMPKNLEEVEVTMTPQCIEPEKPERRRWRKAKNQAEEAAENTAQREEAAAEDQSEADEAAPVQ